MVSRNRGVMTLAVVILGGLLGHDRLPAALAQGPKTSLRGAEFDAVVQKNVMIPMRDGVSLAADIYRPGRDGRPAAGRFYRSPSCSGSRCGVSEMCCSRWFRCSLPVW